MKYEIEPVGGVKPYTYTLTGTNGFAAGPQFGQAFENVPRTGVYTYTVTDAAGNMSDCAFTVNAKNKIPSNKLNLFIINSFFLVRHIISKARLVPKRGLWLLRKS